jgi:flagellar biosynthesis anti-sigma factor FlgM
LNEAMKVRETKEVEKVERTPPPADHAPVRPPGDKVTVEEAPRAAELVSAARHHASATRASRLKELEAVVRSGRYQPDAQRIADQILSAAEIDARLRAMLAKG